MNSLLQQEIILGDAAKTDLRTQFAALCYRIKNEKVQFCLVTSRRSGRWIVPKGWPMNGQTPMDAAATEAFEEAGVRGKIEPRPIGVFSYYKVHSKNELPCIAVVYPLKVKNVLRTWPEHKERNRKWLSRKKAAALVDDAELSQIIMRFQPDTA
ncbi:NUDIX hydrolase-like protein [Octadecabacter arcticus 238]|uniref:NUDIX hydrolase-like protein n=1 Tax=Octadecabacter arcticus 238 TaxID=391616 RepID=M9RRQ4_9RHOB|nr:NUDIX hydrolase [Octadecabacter arcticus]AGI73141.1 NUDIX hydrolase-like protein [Octadecabacter arcticus 238]